MSNCAYDNVRERTHLLLERRQSVSARRRWCDMFRLAKPRQLVRSLLRRLSLRVAPVATLLALSLKQTIITGALER